MVVKTPGLSRYRPEVTRLSGLGIPVVGGLGLWLAEADLRRVLCVTGTKGKSTTSSVTGHLLTRLGYRCMVGGNIGASPYDPAEAGDFDYWVIEVSSYQATDLPYSPPVVAVTSLHPDHLDWHGGLEQYYRDKLSACSQPGAELTVANGDSDLLRERAALLGPRVEWVCVDDDPGADWMEPLGLLGRHNRRNALIARRCLVALGVPGAGDDARLRAAAAGYRPLPSRLTSVGTIGGVTFVDDSLSTNVLPTLAALDSFPGRRIALIAGGHDRGIDYAPLAAGVLARPAPTLVLTLPDSGSRIAAEIVKQEHGESAAFPDRMPGPGSRRGGGIPVGAARWGGAAVPGRAELRPVPGLPRPGRSLRPRGTRDFVTRTAPHAQVGHRVRARRRRKTTTQSATVMPRWRASSGARATSCVLSMVAPRSDSYPAEIPGEAPRRSTSVQVTFVKSARIMVQPPKLTRNSVAPPNSTSRSRQFSNLTSVSVPLRKFTESSLQSRNVTRRSPAENACTPARAQPARVVSSQPVSARSLETNLVSRIVTSVNLVFLSLPSLKETLPNTQSRKWQFPVAVSSNEVSANRNPSYSWSGSRSPSCGVSDSSGTPAMDRLYRANPPDKAAGIRASPHHFPGPPGPL